ncbi:MAG TPA: hypothetical protein ENK57_16035, partial [Polyangiaceae bacterium]|nr:hypothetical protein [Polyangiaceae bacterium]
MTMHTSRWILGLALTSFMALAVGEGCGGNADTNADGGGSADPSTGPGPSTTGLGEGLPCDVVDVLAQECVACHADPPTAGAPVTLLTYDDLLAPAASDPSKTLAEVSLERMKDTVAPMPPGLGPSDEAIAVFEAWVA